MALDATTGRKVWSFQLIHHDVWDYDVASEPLLFDFQGHIPAVAIAAKPGILFVFNRLTGQPLFPVTERPVPASDVPGEHLSPTQPFTSLQFNPLTIDMKHLTGHSGQSLSTCASKFASLRYDGIFTPPSLKGSLQFPGSLGGVNWSSMSFDPNTATLYANTNRSAYEMQLIPHTTRFDRLKKGKPFWGGLLFAALLSLLLLRRRLIVLVPVLLLLIALGIHGYRLARPASFSYQRNHNLVNSPDSIGEVSPNRGAPYSIYRRVLEDDEGLPCTPVPWGATTALNLNTGQKQWETPLGTLVAGQHSGTVNFGAPIVTAGGLLFTAASKEPLLRAIDKSTGEEVWDGPLPVPAQSTPMTYTLHGRQFVVVAAGGHGGLGTPLGDSVVAFALPTSSH